MTTATEDKSMRQRPWANRDGVAHSLVPLEKREYYFDVRAGVFREIQIEWIEEPKTFPGEMRRYRRGPYLSNPRDGSFIEKHETVAKAYDLSETRSMSLLDAYVALRGRTEFSDGWLARARRGRRTFCKPSNVLTHNEFEDGLGGPMPVPDAPDAVLLAQSTKRDEELEAEVFTRKPPMRKTE